jgi:hypothetical protein
MVTLTNDEINEMREDIKAGRLPPDAIEQHFKAEALNVFGFDAKKTRDGKSYIEQGVGSASNQTLNSINAYKKFGAAEPDYERNLARMEREFAESEARRRKEAQS